METRKFFAPVVVLDKGQSRTLLLDLVVPFRMKNDQLCGAWYDEQEQKVHGSFVPISVWEFDTVPDILYALEMKVNTTHAILAERQRRMEHNRRILEAHKDDIKAVLHGHM